MADALLRCHSNPNMPILEDSPDEHDPHLDAFDEPTRYMKLPSGDCLDNLLQDRHSEVNDVQVKNSGIPFKALYIHLALH